MDLQLDGKLAIVTGSTGDGIGFAIARELSRYGAHVVLNSRYQLAIDTAIEQIVQEVGCTKENLHGVVGDLGSSEGVDAFVEKVSAIEKEIDRPVDILVNNVGMFHVQDFKDISDDKWLDYYNLNTMSGVRLSRHYLPAMLERNNDGRILFISSECGLRPLPHMTAYSVSKSSQISLARGLAETTKGTTVTVNSVLPGPTLTGGVKVYMEDFGKEHGIDDKDEAIARYFKEHETTSLLQRFLDPKEIANVVAFLSSPMASGINGTAQRVEGGIVRHL